MRMRLILILVLMIIILAAASPCYAYNGQASHYGFGAGAIFPDIDGVETDSALYYLFDYRSMDYLFEVNYVDDDDMTAWFIHGDYIYPLTGLMQTQAYVGVGYSYMFADSDVLEDESGIDICFGLNIQENIDIRGRYLFLGGGDNILTAGATWYLQ